MAKRFIVFNNKIIKFGSTGIIFDSENSGGGVVADPFRSAIVTAVVENGYVKPTITGDTNNDLDHWSVYVAGQSGNKYIFKNSMNVNLIIDYFGLTAPDNSVKTYSMRIQGVTANGTTTSTSSFSIAVTGAVVDPMEGASITATANTTTVSWTNLSSVSTFSNYEYYLTTNSANVKTTTSNSVTIEALKTQFSLADNTTYQLRVRAKSTNGNYSNLAAVTFTTPAATSGGGSTDTPATTVTTWSENFSDGIANVTNDSNGWYDLALVDGKLRAILEEPDSTQAAAVFNITFGETLDLSSGAYLSVDIGAINSKPDNYTGNGAAWNEYNCLTMRLVDANGGTSNWIDIDAGGVGGSSNGIGGNNIPPTVANENISSYLGTINKAKIVKLEISLICFSADINDAAKYKKRNKGLTFDNFKLSNSAT